MKFKYFLVPMFALIACGPLQAQNAEPTASPSPSESQQFDHWRGHGHHHWWLWKKLNLTDQQKEQIKSIRQNLKAQVRPALAAVLKARMQLMQDIDSANQGAIAADTTALANAQVQFWTLRATQWNQIKGVLTPDQQNTLSNFKQKMQTRTQDMINKLSQPNS
jgi:Spy/CpxP family protein refolding chaperone